MHFSSIASSTGACWSSRYYDAINQIAIPVRLADPLEEPFATFIDPHTIQEKILTGNLRDDPLNGSSLMQHLFGLKSRAAAWRMACGRDQVLLEPVMKAQRNILAFQNRIHDEAQMRRRVLCIENELSVKLANIAIVRERFSWDPDSPNGIIAMLRLELLARMQQIKTQRVPGPDF